MIVDAPPVAAIHDDGATLSVSLDRGDFAMLAAHWVFSDGTSADGLIVPHPAAGVSATVTVVDGAGDTAVAHA